MKAARAGGIGAAFIAASIAIATAQSPTVSPRVPAAAAPEKIRIDARPIEALEPREPSTRQFGALQFRGGLVLASAHKDFGGLSAIRVQEDGSRFIAVTDKGNWLSGRIVYERERPVGIADAGIAPVLGPDGRPIRARGWYDTESMAQDGGTLYLGLERVHRILRFDFARHGPAARGQIVAAPPGVGKLPSNKGIECLTVVRRDLPLAGTLIAISERGLDDNGDTKGFLIGGPSPGEFSLKRGEDFDVSDCANAPSGDLLVLERKFSWATGVQIRIRRIALSSVKPGALLDGPALFRADMGYEIDNMEGLSVHQTRAGDVVLTLVSDDNFSVIQRTLLLQFTLTEP